MKKFYIHMMMLAAMVVVGAAMTSCQKEEAITGKFSMTVNATKGGSNSKALSEGTNTINARWLEGEEVMVYHGENLLGTLRAQSADVSTTLVGEIEVDDDDNIEQNDVLTLKFCSPNYATQDGTLTGNPTSIDKVCDYAEAEVTVTSVGNGKLHTDSADFENKQAIVKFTLKDNGNAAINATQLVVSDGTHTFTVTPASDTSVLYVAMPGFEEQTITLTAIDGSDAYTYITKSAVSIANNQYYEIEVRMEETTLTSTGAVTLVGSGDTPIAATGGVILSNSYIGGVTEVGICWGTAENPTIDNSHAAAAGHTVGNEYTVNMGTLDEGTTYYIRSYAKIGDDYYYASPVSEKSYYLIDNLTDWNNFATLVNNGTDATAKAVQMANISGVTTVVGNSDHPFKGSYNGQGYTISNVNISGSTNVGLFGVVNNASSVIENVVVASGKVYGSGLNVGAVVGQLNSGTVRYCANYAEVESEYNGNSRTGGIVGWTTSSGGTNNHVSYCINYGYVHAKAYAGGIVGSYGAGSITYCQNYGLIKTTGASTAGGIAGWQYSSSYVPAYNHNGGDITTSSSNTASNTNRYLISNRNSNNSNYSSNSYLTSLTATIAGTSYTGADLAQFAPSTSHLTSNPAGITIGDTTYSWNTPAP